jgi:3-oxoacyl-[acyl-carrier protein] reductase
MTGTTPNKRALQFDFSNREILVTGGTQGIGLGIAQAFASAGAKVHITGTRASAEDYEENLSEYIYHRARMERPQDREALAERISGLSILINNAGAAHDEEGTTEGFIKSIEVNLIAPADISFRFHGQIRSRGGAVVNIGSGSCFLGLKGYPAYTAAKSGLLGFTRAMADRWARDGIRVNLVAPGFIDTRMNDWVKDREALLRSLPAGRFGRPEDVAGAVLFLASDEASYITGQSLIVDGGMVLR